MPIEGRVVGRHRELLSNPKVRSWWEARSLRSRLSADQYLRQFGHLLERIDLTPDSILVLAKKNPERLRTLLIRDAARMKSEGRLDSYISKFFEGLKSYFRHHHTAFDGWPSLAPIKGASLVAERVPTPEELGQVLVLLSTRGKVIALFMAHTGVRPGVLGSYEAEDGLRLGDLPDLKLGEEPSFNELPFVIRVPARLSKSRMAYTSFGSTELALTLLKYLKDRRERGEQLSADSPVIAANPSRGIALESRNGARFSKGFLTTKQVIEEIREALHSRAPEDLARRIGGRQVAGWRPYVLRAYCSTRLLLAESAGKIPRDLREALLGHNGGIAARYNVGKAWGPELLKEARLSYSRGEPFLSTSQGMSESLTQAKMAKAMLIGLRYTEDQLARLDLGSLDSETFTQLVATAPILQPKPEPPRPKVKQQVVKEEDLPGFLAEGWTVHTSLSGGKVVINAPV